MKRIVWAVALTTLASSAGAGTGAYVGLNAFLYADNTEFLSNPYRNGETLLGGQLRLELGLPVGGSSRFLLGVMTDSRWGSDRPFETKRPVIALEAVRGPDTFVLGTLRSGQLGRKAWQGLWPDESGPHGLVPVLQLDTLTMTRPYEAGLQWLRTGDNWRHDVWLAWQALNTPEHRERFDLGANVRVGVLAGDAGSISLLAQGHVVHEGGQLYHAGVVGDSLAGGPGVQVRWYLGSGTLCTDALFLFAKHNPVRADPSRADRLNGTGRLLRITYEHGDWRAAYLRWHHGKDFIKWEGDPNYGSLGDMDGTPFIRSRRTYGEFSLSRRFGFTMTENAYIIVNARAYRVDGTWDYAYRVAATVNATRRLRRDR